MARLFIVFTLSLVAEHVTYVMLVYRSLALQRQIGANSLFFGFRTIVTYKSLIKSRGTIEPAVKCHSWVEHYDCKSVTNKSVSATPSRYPLAYALNTAFCNFCSACSL